MINSPTKNLNLAQAVQSGFPFRREGWDFYIELIEGVFENIYTHEIAPVQESWFLSSDWEIREVEFTESQFWYAYGVAIKGVDNQLYRAVIKESVRMMAVALGMEVSTEEE